MSVLRSILDKCYEWGILIKPFRIIESEAEQILDSEDVREDITEWLQNNTNKENIGNIGEYIVRKHVHGSEIYKNQSGASKIHLEMSVRRKTIQLVLLSLVQSDERYEEIQEDFRTNMEPIAVDIRDLKGRDNRPLNTVEVP